MNAPLQPYAYAASAVAGLSGLGLVALRFVRLVGGEGLPSGVGNESWQIIRRFGPYAVGGLLTLVCMLLAQINWQTADSKLFDRAVRLAAKSDRVKARIGDYRAHGLLWSATSVIQNHSTAEGGRSRYAYGSYSCRLIGSTGAVNASFSIRCWNASPCELETIELE